MDVTDSGSAPSKGEATTNCDDRVPGQRPCQSRLELSDLSHLNCNTELCSSAVQQTCQALGLIHRTEKSQI